ncbi:restriction endonuclease subunit S [Variovorax sp. E3]|uniref:restriction endonuclease subunit S n=1 Tax=Variovorax sp. E3 TaxID=1914993 RepID=UPI0018DB1E99|nr:restriction endonuclease subunit S [Variovorax sp. E3]
MSSEWAVSTVGSVCTKVFSGGTPTSTNAAFYDGDIPWLRTKEVNYGKIFKTEQCISQLGFENSSVKLVPINSVIVAMYGNGDTAGRVAINKVPLTTNQACCNLLIDPDRADYRFIYYYLMGRYSDLVDLKNGGAQQNLNARLVKEFSIRVPPLVMQRSIADFLEALDDRIILLRETNATLDAIAQALFKSWFVDFDPVHAKMEGRDPDGMDETTASLFSSGLKVTELGAVPIGWTVAPISDVVSTAGGATPDTKNEAFWSEGVHSWTTPKDLSGLATPVLLNTERKLSPAGLSKIGSGLLPRRTLLLSSRAPIGYLALTEIPMAINQGYIAMLPGGQLPPLYLLFWCRQNMELIKARANGSTFMEISKKAFRPIPVLVPPPPIVEAFMRVAESIFDRLVENEKQAQTLAALRDALLPRLISGQLRLPEIERNLPDFVAA